MRCIDMTGLMNEQEKWKVNEMKVARAIVPSFASNIRVSSHIPYKISINFILLSN